ncbi:hypothetical protein MMC34_008002 [Xylographa carneopallida]|nr:hypothetical protein [Xylographa carneopallida]
MRTPQCSAGIWLSIWCTLQSLSTLATAQLSENIGISVPPGVSATTERLTLQETVAITIPEIMVTKTVVSPVTITQTIMNLETVTAIVPVTQLVTDLKTVTSTIAMTQLVTSLKNVTATMPVVQLVTDVKTLTATSVVNQVQMVTVTVPGTCTFTYQFYFEHHVKAHDYNINHDYFDQTIHHYFHYDCHVKTHDYNIYDLFYNNKTNDDINNE